MAQIAMFKGLTEQQRAFVQAYLQGDGAERAAKVAGYSQSGPNPGYQVLHSPLIVAAIQTAVRHDLLTDGTRIANAALKEIAGDKQAPKGARVDAAKALLDRAGIIAKKAEDKSRPGDKPLQDMSIGELEDVIRQREANARDVTPRADSDVQLPVAPAQEPDIFD